MTKDRVLDRFEDELADPAYEKDGSLLADALRSLGHGFLKSDRSGLVEALRNWLEAREMTRTLQAARLTGDLDLVELEAVLTQLRAEVAAGNALRPSAKFVFDQALQKLGQPGS